MIEDETIEDVFGTNRDIPLGPFRDEKRDLLPLNLTTNGARLLTATIKITGEN